MYVNWKYKAKYMKLLEMSESLCMYAMKKRQMPVLNYSKDAT